MASLLPDYPTLPVSHSDPISQSEWIFLFIWINFPLITSINIQMSSIIVKNENMFIKIQLFSFLLRSIAERCPSLPSCLPPSTFRWTRNSKLLLLLRKVFTHNLWICCCYCTARAAALQINSSTNRIKTRRLCVSQCKLHFPPHRQC